MAKPVMRWSAGVTKYADGKITAIPDNHGDYVLHADYAALEAENARLRAAKDGSYSERDRLVAALSKCFPSWLARHPDSDATWDNDWRWIVFIEIPVIRYLTHGDQRNGHGPHYVVEHKQASWHIHDSERAWFNHLKVGENSWDGHTNEEKYARLAALAPAAAKEVR